MLEKYVRPIGLGRRSGGAFLYRDGQPHVNRTETELRCALLKTISDEVGQPTSAIADRFHHRPMNHAVAQALAASEAEGDEAKGAHRDEAE
jgi:hypothetical protein